MTTAGPLGATGQAWVSRFPNDDPTGYSGYLDLVSAADANIVFAQAGRDLLRSADGGDTWTKVTDLRETWGLIADPSQPTVMYLTGRMQLDPSLTPEQQAYDYHNNPDFRLCKSVDSGATWTPIVKIKEAGVGLTFFFDSHDPARLYTLAGGDESSGSGARLMRSLDGGLTWEQVDFSSSGAVLRLAAVRSSFAGHRVRQGASQERRRHLGRPLTGLRTVAPRGRT